MTKLKEGYVRKMEDDQETYYALPDNVRFTISVYLRGGGQVRIGMSKKDAIELGESWATYVKDKYAARPTPFGFVGGLGWGILLDEVIAVNVWPAAPVEKSFWRRITGR